MKKRGAARNWLEWAAARFVLATLRLGSFRTGVRVARVWVRLLDLCVPKLRRVARINLTFALPGEDAERIIGESFDSLARMLVTLARLKTRNRGNLGEWIRYEGLEHFVEAKKRGKGVLFATAHLGNWELSAFAHGMLTEPMHVVVRALDNPLLDGEARRLRTMSGNRVIEKRDFARGILRALGRNEAVGILIDQNVGLAEGEFVPFFGKLACVSPGLAKLAAHSGAAVIPGFALWSEAEGRYVLKFYEPLWGVDTAAIHARLEEVIRAHPGQWLWMHRRWKTRPAGEGDLYG